MARKSHSAYESQTPIFDDKTRPKSINLVALSFGKKLGKAEKKRETAARVLLFFIQLPDNFYFILFLGLLALLISWRRLGKVKHSTKMVAIKSED